MDCRDEVFTWKTPPTDLPGTLTDLIEGGGESDAPPAGTTTERICRTVHGPVQHTGEGIALARRYAIWNRELETIVGIDELNHAEDIADVDEAMDAGHLERERDGGRLGRPHRLLAPRPPPAQAEEVGRAPALPRHRQGRVARPACRPTSAHR